MRLALVIPSLYCGGAERAVSTLANYWTDHGWEVHLITLEHASSDAPFFPLAPQVTLHHLGLFLKNMSSRGGAADEGPPPYRPCTLISSLKTITKVPRALASLRKTLTSIAPDAIISSITGCNILTILSNLKTGIPILACEHSHPTLYRAGFLRTLLRPVVYPYAAKIVVLSEAQREALPRLLHQKTVVIPNPLPQTDQALLAAQRGKTITAIGRLEPVKGMDLLIEAFGLIAARFPSWKLEIWGAGSQYSALAEQSERLQLGAQCRLCGPTNDSAGVLVRSAFAVVPSHVEGFGLTAAEALSLGTPVVCFDCPGGISGVVTDRKTGLVVKSGDVAALAEAMRTLIEDDALRLEFARQAPKGVAGFALPAVAERWNAVLRGVGALQ